ncbi:hypothetical protein D3C75_775910 [compost metagenome]
MLSNQRTAMKLAQPVMAGHDNNIGEQQREAARADQKEIDSLRQQHSKPESRQHRASGDKDSPVRNICAVPHPSGSMPFFSQ